MIYLKCPKCGHLNEVKTQYLTFCAGCNKKLDNSFAAWQVLHPDGSFEDYQQQVCLTGEQVKAVPPPAKRTLNKARLIKFSAVGILAIALLFVVGHYAVKAANTYLHSLMNGGLPASILTQHWSRETYGNYGLSIETPVKLNRGNLPLPANIRDVIEYMDVFDYQSVKGFKIMLSCIRYKPVVDSISLQGAANGSVNEARLQPGVTDFNYTEQPYHTGDVPGFLQKGTFRMNEQGIEFQNAGFVKGLNLWQVWIGYPSDDEVGKKMADRIISSIKIDYEEK